MSEINSSTLTLARVEEASSQSQPDPANPANPAAAAKDKASDDNHKCHKWTDLAKSLFGDFDLGKNLLRNKPDKSPWAVLKILDAILRGVAQVCFANNPISGLLILVGLAFHSWDVALGGFVGPLVAVVTCLILDQPRALVEDGLSQFNACLVGTVLVALYPTAFKGQADFAMWLVAIVMSAMSVPVQTGLANILSSLSANYGYRLGDPEDSLSSRSRSLVGLTFPFNVVAIVAVFCLNSYHGVRRQPFVDDVNVDNREDVDWVEVLRGILLSGGEVYAADTEVGSALIYLGLAIYSPVLAVVSITGAAIGTLLALLFRTFPLSMAYSGLWGFSPVLTAGALGHTFFAPSWRTTGVLTLLGCVLTAGVQLVLLKTVGFLGVPFFTLPFVLTTWFFLIVNSKNDSVMRR